MSVVKARRFPKRLSATRSRDSHKPQLMTVAGGFKAARWPKHSPVRNPLARDLSVQIVALSASHDQLVMRRSKALARGDLDKAGKLSELLTRTKAQADVLLKRLELMEREYELMRATT